MDTDSINIDIGRRIRNHRNRNGLTQQELARGFAGQGLDAADAGGDAGLV